MCACTFLLVVPFLQDPVSQHVGHDPFRSNDLFTGVVWDHPETQMFTVHNRGKIIVMKQQQQQQKYVMVEISTA